MQYEKHCASYGSFLKPTGLTMARNSLPNNFWFILKNKVNRLPFLVLVLNIKMVLLKELSKLFVRLLESSNFMLLSDGLMLMILPFGLWQCTMSVTFIMKYQEVKLM